MHSELYCQHGLVEAAIEQALEHAPAVASLFRVAGEGRCWQLLLVADEDDPLRGESQRDQRLHLG